MCGNGIRGFGKMVADRGLTKKDELRIETDAGLKTLTLLRTGGVIDRVSVDMGVPEFEPSRIPFDAPARAVSYGLDVDGRRLDICALSMGNPHAVQMVPEVDSAPVNTQGPLIERHPRFPQRVNAGYMQIVDRGHIRLRVYERGAGETLACGSGACAAVVAGRQRGLLDDKVDVKLLGGTLRVSWAGEGQPVWMTGPAVTVFEGTIDLDRL